MASSLSTFVRQRFSSVILALLMIVTVTTVVVNPTPASATPGGGAVCNIVTGADRPSQQIARLYKAVFHRPPEPEGWNYWKGVVQTRSLFDIAGFFVTAPEFVNLYGAANNDEFVRLVYVNVMGRQPEAEGYNYWLGVLNSGAATRAEMVVYFSESSEFKRRENDLYFERCPLLAPSKPTVLSYEFSEYQTSENPGTWWPLATRAKALDGGNGARAYASASYIGGNKSYLGRKKALDSCVSWREVPAGIAVLTMEDALFVPEVVGQDYSESQFLSMPQEMRWVVDEFEHVVDVEGTGVPVGSCVDRPDILSLAATRLEVFPDFVAESVDTRFGLVRREIGLGTDDLRKVANSDPWFVTGLEPNLKLLIRQADENNAELRQNGHGHLADNRLAFVMVVWEDYSGNLVQMRYRFDIYKREISTLTQVHQARTGVLNRVRS